MQGIRPTNINAFYAELEVAKGELVAAQAKVEALKQSIRERGGELPEDNEKATAAKPEVKKPKPDKKPSVSKKGKE